MKVRLLTVVMVLIVGSLGATTLGDYSQRVRTELESAITEKMTSLGGDQVAGTVTMIRPDGLFLQGKEDALKVVFSEGLAGKLPKLAAGDQIEARGGPSLEGGRVVFVAESITGIGRAELPPAVKAGVIELSLSEGGNRNDVNWRRVEVEGRVLSITDTGFAMNVEDTPITVLASKLPDFMSDADETHPLVRVTGVVEKVLDQSALFRKEHYVMGVKLFAAAPDDIVLEEDAVYLMNRHDRRVWFAYFAALGVLLVVVVLFLALIVRQARRHLRTSTLMRERKRMADDLHDTIEQHLVGAGMLLQLGQTKEAREILIRAKKEMRDIVWGLQNDDMMRLTPAEMIRELARTENRKGICRVDVGLKGLPEHLDAASMRDLSLIVREAIGNAIKHGGAKKVAIAADPLDAGGWMMRISNDGAPFEPDKAPGPAEGHFGLEGMKARARRIGAKLEISTKDNRTIISIVYDKSGNNR